VDRRCDHQPAAADVAEAAAGFGVGAGRAGPITKALQKAFFDVVTGKDRKHKHWLTPVPMKKSRK